MLDIKNLRTKVKLHEVARTFAQQYARSMGCTLRANDDVINESGQVVALYQGFEFKEGNLSLKWKLLTSMQYVEIKGTINA